MAPKGLPPRHHDKLAAIGNQCELPAGKVEYFRPRGDARPLIRPSSGSKSSSLIHWLCARAGIMATGYGWHGQTRMLSASPANPAAAWTIVIWTRIGRPRRFYRGLRVFVSDTFVSDTLSCSLEQPAQYSFPASTDTALISHPSVEQVGCLISERMARPSQKRVTGATRRIL